MRTILVLSLLFAGSMMSAEAARPRPEFCDGSVRFLHSARTVSAGVRNRGRFATDLNPQPLPPGRRAPVRAMASGKRQH